MNKNQYNEFAASITEFVLKMLLERTFFQNSSISQASLLYLANDLIRILRPQKNTKMDVIKEIVITYKQFSGKTLSPEEQEYEESEREIDVANEILNGLSYSSLCLISKSFFSSVVSTARQGLWEHLPALAGFTGAVLYGPHIIQSAIEQVLSFTQLTLSQQQAVRPWLFAIGRLALGFVPKVHATSTGVHYHYPSFSGATTTYGKNFYLRMSGEDLTYLQSGKLTTPDGKHAAEYIAKFKLDKIDSLTEQSIRIHVANDSGETVPVDFKMVLGEFGPHIHVTSTDTALASHWSRYFHYFTSAILAANMMRSNHASLLSGLLLVNALSPVNALSENPNLKAQCLMNMCNQLFDRGDYLRAKALCAEALKAGLNTARIHYILGEIAVKMGAPSQALIEYNNALALNSSFLEAISSNENILKKYDAYYNVTREGPARLSYNSSTRETITTYCESENSMRNPFFREHEIRFIKPAEYLGMTMIAYHLDATPEKKAELIARFSDIYAQLHDLGWEEGESFARRPQSGYTGLIFINNATKNIAIVHRSMVSFLCIQWQHEKNIFDPAFNEEANAARNFTQKIKSKYPNFYITHTGYHIGAAIAETIACEYSSIAITANSPGNLLHNNFLCDAQIVTYVGNQNFINTLTNHLGSIRHVDQGPSKFFDLYSIYCVKFSRYEILKPELIQLLYLVLMQKLQEIIGRINICTGYPYQTYHVKHWRNNPIEKVKGLTFFEMQSLDFTNNELHRIANEGIKVDELPLDFQRLCINNRMELTHFSVRAQNFLKSYLINGLYPDNINPRILKLYSISENNEVVLTPDGGDEVSVFTITEFQDYLEMKLYQAKEDRINWAQDNFFRRDITDMTQHCHKYT